MTGREWKPGDVAWRSYLGNDLVSLRVTDCSIDGHEVGEHWHHADGGWDSRNGLSTYHPLVVIDPVDREQVEWLRKVLIDSGAFTGLTKGNIRKLQAALREFANPTPPKPKPLLDRLKERAPDGLIDPALAEQVVKEWLADNAEEVSRS